VGRVLAVIVLLLRFVQHAVSGGVQTLRVILRQRRGAPASPPVLVRVPITPLPPQGSALLGCLLSLTPGSTVIDIDAAEGELLLHVLDPAGVDALVAGIRRDFEPPLRTLYGR
jgi:multisubunit Na+/H+ antiporter MnhE subunit